MKIKSLALVVLNGLVLGISLVAMGLLVLWQRIVLVERIPSDAILWPFIAVSLVLTILWGSILVHELGHLLAALAERMRIYYVLVGPVKFVRDNGRFRVRLNWKSKAAGYVIAMPTGVDYIRRRLLVFIIAGPLANLLVAALLLGLGIRGNELSSAPPRVGEVTPARVPWMPQNFSTNCLYFAAVMNLMLFWQNLIPDTSGGFTTDGGQLLALVWGGRSGERQLLLFTLSAVSQGGSRPRDWDGDIVARILAPPDGTAQDAVANLYGYYHALDCGRIEEADRRLKEASAMRELCMAEGQPAILLESAYFSAFHLHDAGEARMALDLTEEGIEERQTRLRAEAAVLFAEGHYEEAAAKAQAGLDVVFRSIDPGGAIAEAEWLTAIWTACRERMGQDSITRRASPT